MSGFVFIDAAACRVWLNRQAIHSAAAGATTLRITPDRYVAICKVAPSAIQWVQTTFGCRFHPVFDADDGRRWDVVLSAAPVELQIKRLDAVNRGMTYASPQHREEQRLAA